MEQDAGKFLPRLQKPSEAIAKPLPRLLKPSEAIAWSKTLADLYLDYSNHLQPYQTSTLTTQTIRRQSKALPRLLKPSEDRANLYPDISNYLKAQHGANSKHRKFDKVQRTERAKVLQSLHEDTKSFSLKCSTRKL